MTAKMSSPEALGALKRFFLTPPRKHGEVEHGREVSFLELFYDLVYVVIIGQAAHHLATHQSWAGLGDFAVVFGLIWLAWFNGTLWHEIHGREDGRSRTNIFVQMGLIALLAVYTGHATDSDGAAFATVYLILFAWYTYQWWCVHRIDDPTYHPTTRQYLAGMVVTLVAMAVSIGVSETARVWIWAAIVIAWVVGGFLANSRTAIEGFSESVTNSMVERFGLFTIVVLGEVVIGVVGGLSESDARTGLTVAVAMFGLAIGMGLWWNYFDALGRRVPSASGARLSTWIYTHLPLTMAISAAGAAMIPLVEHADDSRTPTATAWLLGGGVATALLCIALSTQALPTTEFPGRMLAKIPRTLGVGVVATIVVTALRPSPLILAIALLAVLSLTWFWLILQFFAEGGTTRPQEPGRGAEV